MNQEVRKMTNVNILAPVQGHDAEGPDLAQGTGDQRAGHGADLILGAGGGPRAHGGGGLTPETEATAVDPGTEGRRRSQKNDQRHLQKATAVLGDLEVLAGDTAEAAVHLALLGRSHPDLHLHDAIKKRKRRTKIVKRSGTESGGKRGTAVETKESAPAPRRRRAKTRSEIENASLTVRKEM